MKTQIRILDKPEEFVESGILGARAFNFTFDPESEDGKKPTPFADTWGAFEDGKLISQIIAFRYQMNVHGKYVPMCGIGSVCSLIEGRNKGNIRKLFAAIFDKEREAGCMYSYLYPFSFRYYDKFGYGHGFRRVAATIPIERLKGYECTYDVTMYKPGDPFGPYEAVFEKFSSGYTGMVKQNDWKKLDDYIPEKNNRSMFLLSENGIPKAFIGYKNDGDLKTQATPWSTQYAAWADADAFKNMLGFLYRLRMHNKNLVMLLPESLPIEAMLLEQRDVKLERYMSGQARVIDVKGALTNFPWPRESGELYIGVRDDYFADQCAVYQIHYGGGEACVVKSDKPADIELDIRALAPLLLGVYGYDDLAYQLKGLVAVNKNEGLLEKIFIRRPAFFTEQF
jgi:predicted acetyltransferase